MRIKNTKMHHGVVQLFIFSLFLVVAGFFAKTSHSGNLSTVSVTMSNSRPSFRTELAAGNSEGSTIAIFNTTQFPSRSTAQLVEGDQVRILSGATGATTEPAYTISEVPAADRVSLGAILASGDADAGDVVIATESSTLTVRFTTVNAIANGSFRILVPAHATDATAADGIPDEEFFDMNEDLSEPTVTCPANGDATYNFSAGTAVESSVTLDGVDYHAFTCAYTGTGDTSAFDNAVGASNGAIEIDSLINPAPDNNPSVHTVGTADTYNVIVQHLYNGGAVADQTSTSIGVIEAVRVTATIDPQISFIIGGYAASSTHCNVTADVTTTAAAVPFGSLDLGGFLNAAQSLSVTTNALEGYVVTAIANDQMGRNGGSCTGAEGTDVSDENVCIQDSAGDGAAMSPTVEEDWDTSTNKGLAYALEDGDTDTLEAFAYDSTSTGSCTVGTFCARQFADLAAAEDPQTVFSNTTVADTQEVDICYRIIPSVTDAAGKYENHIIYTATATF